MNIKDWILNNQTNYGVMHFLLFVTRAASITCVICGFGWAVWWLLFTYVDHWEAVAALVGASWVVYAILHPLFVDARGRE